MEFRLAPFTLAVLLIFAWPFSALTQDSDEGTVAYNAGDYATAERIWRGQAAEGNAAAKYNLGILYENGFGVEKNAAEAKSWYTQAAEQDNEMAVMAIAAIRYAEKNFAEALSWYGKAADRGDPDAQVQVGNMYLSGEGTAVDETQAVAWFERAGGNGHNNAQHWLGDWYGEHQDNKNALKWYDKAATGGIAEAEPKRNAIYESLFVPALGGEVVSAVSVDKTPIERGLFDMMGQQSKIVLTRKYENSAAGTILAARITINDFQGQALIDLMHTDPATAEDPDQKVTIEALQSNTDIQAYEFSGNKGLAEYEAGQLRAVVLAIGEDFIFEYDFGESGVAPIGIDTYLPATKFSEIADTLDGHGFEPSFLASEQGQNMFNDFSEDIARELEEQESSSE